MAEQFDLSTLNWIKGEIDETLKQARIALESFAEDPDDEPQLRFCVTYLHQVRGTLQMVELLGAAQLAEEMEQLGKALLDGHVTHAENRFEALMRAILQLPDYLESLQSGQQDNPVVLLPVINDLRRSRGAAPLTEAYFFSPDLSIHPSDEGFGSADMAPLATKLRPYYQAALLKLLQDQEVGKGLATIAAVLEKLRAGASEPATRQWLWVTAGFIEALANQGLALDGAVKQLLTKIDQLLKFLAESGEFGLREETLTRLNRALLYHVAKASSSGEKVEALKSAFELRRLMPEGEAVQQAADALGGFNAELKKTVSADIMEELSQVKDVLDIFARSETPTLDRLEEMAEGLARTAETLGLLGQEELRTDIASQVGAIRGMLDSNGEIDDETLMGIAGAVLSVETALKDWGTAGTVEKADADEEQVSEGGLQAEAEHQRVVRQVMKEAREDLIRIREAVNHYLGAPEKGELLEPVSGWLHGLIGSLSMLSYKRVAQVLRACGAFIDERLTGAEELPGEEQLDALADAMMSVEYYLDAFVQSRVHPGSVLDVAERAVATLGYAVDSLPEAAAVQPEPEASEAETESVADTGATEETPAEVAVDEAPAEDAAAPAANLPPEVDEEILEIFIEEAEEELNNIGQLLPRWRNDTSDSDALGDLRRSFHTLKGSGRLVGAVDVGEFAWAFESMLNRVIDNTVTHSEAMFDLIEQAAEVLPGLIEAFRTGAAAPAEATELAEMAEAICSPGGLDSLLAKQGGSTAEPAEEPAETVTDEVAAEEPELAEPMDPVLLEIYSNEAAGHLQVIEDYVESHQGLDHARVNEPLIRALHTLTGSSRMAGVDEVAEIGSSLEQHAKAVQAAGITLDAHVISLLVEGMAYVRAKLAALAGEGDEPEFETLKPQLDELRKQTVEMGTEVHPEMGLASVEGLEVDENEAAEEVEEITLEAAESEESGGESAPVEALTAELEDLAEELSVEPVAEPEPEAEPEAEPEPEPEPEPVAVDEDYDPELMDIFLEEGAEILDASEETLQSWADNPDERELVEQLQRQLHTLKGSARMAGVTQIGDLGHSLESIFEEVVDGVLERTPRMIELLQLSHDRLVEMLEQVRDRKPVSTGDDLIEKVNALREGREEEVVAAAEEAPVDADTLLVEAPVLDAAMEGLERLGDAYKVWKREQSSLPLLEAVQARLGEFKVGLEGLHLGDAPILCRSLTDLLDKVKDGHVDVSEELLSLFELARDRLSMQLSQREEGAALSDSADLRDDIDGLVRRGRLEAPSGGAAAEGENKRQAARIQHEMVRVRSDLLDNLVNFAGEVSIYRSRVEQQIGSYRSNIGEMDQTLERLRDQLRQFDIETEAQIEYRYLSADETLEDFDPLEFDRFTHMQQLSRSMMESLADLLNIEETMTDLSRETETLLLQQARVNTELQESLMHTRMVPLVENAPRLRRIVRQTCADLGKQATLHFEGAEVEMDRNVVERMMAPLEHMLRNAIAHGIEDSDSRQAAGKPGSGDITLALAREGSEVLIRVSDDGAGIDIEAVREKARERGLITEGMELSDYEVMQFILESGFSTAKELSQVAGRGVGMDVVNSEIKQLGGVLSIDAERGKGTTFTIRLPLTLSVSRALLVQEGEERYAIPLLSIKGIERIDHQRLVELMEQEQPQYEWVGEQYELLHLGNILGGTGFSADSEARKRPVLLAQSGDLRVALVVDELIGSREIVVKSLGAQLSSLQDLAGATILADGSVALILDLPALMRRGLAKRGGELHAELPSTSAEARQPLVMVVDDSITVRKVTERLLKRNDMRAITAKDGVDALAVLEENMPDVMLLDIEMPRMDGYELATHIRNSERLRHLPIIMITSRTGDKHRQRAVDIGVDVYMGKPYTENDLLDNIQRMLEERG